MMINTDTSYKVRETFALSVEAKEGNTSKKKGGRMQKNVL